MIDEGIYKRKDGTIYAVSGGYYAVGLAYNTKEVKTPPSSWWDLWNKDFEGKITMPSPSNAAGVPLFLHWNRLLGGNNANLDAATAKVKDLKVANYFDASGQGEAALQSGEAIIAAHYASAAWGLADTTTDDSSSDSSSDSSTRSSRLLGQAAIDKIDKLLTYTHAEIGRAHV